MIRHLASMVECEDVSLNISIYQCPVNIEKSVFALQAKYDKTSLYTISPDP